MTFKDIALPIASLGVPVIRLKPLTKDPLDAKWQDLATKDIARIMAWDAETPDANCGSVAKSDGFLFFESDEGGVIKRYQEETGETIDTFTVQSRPGRFHFYFKQTNLTRETGSISQKKLKFGSLRQHNAYVVSPGSIHPESKKPYKIVRNSPIVPAPDLFVEWLIDQVGQIQEIEKVKNPDGLVIEGGRNNFLTSIAGGFRRNGLTKDEMFTLLMSRNLERCVPPLLEEEVRTIAWSISKYEPESDTPKLTIGGAQPGTAPMVSTPASSTASLPEITLVESEIPQEMEEYPYASWRGTLYGEFADICGRENVIPKEYFLEAIKTVVGGICGHRITPSFNPNQEGRFYTILLSLHGGIGKSTAMNWARDVFLGTGLVYPLAQDGPGAFINIGCAQGSFSSGSGLINNGTDKHARLLQTYDEITTIIEKFSITGSGDSFLDTVNALYESGFPPGNVTRSTKLKESQVRPVHNSILGGSTFEKWNSSFVKTNSESSGFFQRLNVVTSRSEETVPSLERPNFDAIRDKLIRKIQPLEFQTVTAKYTPEANDLLDKWFKKSKKEWRDKLYSSDVTGRIQVLIHRNAIHMAWLLSPDVAPNPDGADQPIEVEVTADIMERCLDLAEYQLVARSMHQPTVGNNEWAVVENMIKRIVKERKQIRRDQLAREIRADKYGLVAFDRALNNLFKEGMVDFFREAGPIRRGNKGQVIQWVED